MTLHDHLRLQPDYPKEVRETARVGARTPEEAYARLGCEPQCGCCLDYAQEVIDAERPKRTHLRVVAA